MAFFPIYHYHPHNDPVHQYFGDQLDFFDPWYDLNSSPTTVVLVPNTFRWVNEPQRPTHAFGNAHTSGRQHGHTPRAPNSEKFRVQLNVAGFNPETIKTRVEGRKVIVEAKQEDRQPDGDFSIREIRKSYELPEHADPGHMASYITPNHMLLIEVPIKNPETERRLAKTKNETQNLAQFGQHRDPLFDYGTFLSGSDFEPRIVAKGDNQKQLEMLVEMKNFKPDEIKVSVKNDELIIKGEHRNKDDKYSQRTFFFKSTTLPPGTQLDQLQSYLTPEGQLKIEAPFVEQKEATQPTGDEKSSTQSIGDEKGATQSAESQMQDTQFTGDQKENTQSTEDQKQ